MKGFKRVKILCIWGVLLLIVLILSGCLGGFGRLNEETPYPYECDVGDSIWCDVDCDYSFAKWILCEECFDHNCDYDEDDVFDDPYFDDDDC